MFRSDWTQQSVAIQAAAPERAVVVCLYSLHLLSAEESKGSYE